MPKIIGNTTTTPMAIPDWNQTDETKADYIKNKPDLTKLATQEYVDSYLGTLTSGGITRYIVDELPASENASENAIYMIPTENESDNNIYDEYMFFANSEGILVPEIIGSTAVDLSNYYTKTEVDNTITQKSQVQIITWEDDD